LILASCEILHAINGYVLVRSDVGIRFGDGSHRLSADNLEFVCNGSGRASVVVGKCSLTETVAVME
jgi:hypothetical protein